MAAPFPFAPGTEATDLVGVIRLCEALPKDAHRCLLDGSLAAWLRATGYANPAYLAEGLRVSGLPALTCVAQFVDGCRPFLDTFPAPNRAPDPTVDPDAPAAPGAGAPTEPAPTENAYQRARRWGSVGGRVGGLAGTIGMAVGACAVQVLYWLTGGWGSGLPATPPVIVLGVGLCSALVGSLLGSIAGAVTGAVMAVDKPDGPDPPVPWMFQAVLTVFVVLGLLGGWMVTRSLPGPGTGSSGSGQLPGPTTTPSTGSGSRPTSMCLARSRILAVSRRCPDRSASVVCHRSRAKGELRCDPPKGGSHEARSRLLV